MVASLISSPGGATAVAEEGEVHSSEEAAISSQSGHSDSISTQSGNSDATETLTVLQPKREYDPSDGSFCAFVGEIHDKLGHAAHTFLQGLHPGAPDVGVLEIKMAVAYMMLLEDFAAEVHLHPSKIAEIRHAFEWKYCSYGIDVAAEGWI